MPSIRDVVADILTGIAHKTIGSKVPIKPDGTITDEAAHEIESLLRERTGVAFRVDRDHSLLSDYRVMLLLPEAADDAPRA